MGQVVVAGVMVSNRGCGGMNRRRRFIRVEIATGMWGRERTVTRDGVWVGANCVFGFLFVFCLQVWWSGGDIRVAGLW